MRNRKLLQCQHRTHTAFATKVVHLRVIGFDYVVLSRAPGMPTAEVELEEVRHGGEVQSDCASSPSASPD